MAMTMTQKILASHAGMKEVHAGQLIQARVDMVLGNDITTPIAINEFVKAGFSKVFDTEKIALVMDHFVPNKDIKAAQQTKQCRDFAREQQITHFFDVGEMGVEHTLLPEKGLVAPGEVVIGADSHTCTYGALNAFSTGVGSTDMAAAMATGRAWFKVPSAVKFTFEGKLGKNVGGKDVILNIIGKIGVDGARYRSMEFLGDGIGALSIDDRFCISNMAVEAGAKNGIFEYDNITREYLASRVSRGYTPCRPDENAVYDEERTINLSEIVPTVAFPHLPENARPASEGVDITIDQIIIGSCTNGRLSDMAAAARIFKGRRVAKGVRAIIIPATMEVYRESMRLGYTDIFLDAGCVVSTPTCGPCLGGYMGILAEGERCVSTTNRNFVGRMGHPESEVYLSGPEVAAASAVTGRITDPNSL
jgi:3-isopropylmalate/(R)-2-methylmalate dehydratase large subunit